MAVKMNTSQTIERASTALGEKAEKTQKNLKALAARAGCGADPVIEVEIPMGAAPKDDILFIGLNTVSFYFKRGTIAKMPLSVAEIAANTGNLSMGATAMVKEKRAAFEKANTAKAAKTAEPDGAEQKTEKE